LALRITSGPPLTGFSAARDEPRNSSDLDEGRTGRERERETEREGERERERERE